MAVLPRWRLSRLTHLLRLFYLRILSCLLQNTIKGQAKQHPRFRKVCIGFAQWVHRTDYYLRMRVLGENATKIRPLNDTRAIETGANILSEGFIFSVAGGLILFESVRARNKELARRESIADDITTLQDELEFLKRNLKQQRIIIEDYKVPQELNPSVLKIPKREDAPKIYNEEAATTQAKPEVPVTTNK